MEEAGVGAWPDWMADWTVPFAETIDETKKYVVSSTLDQVDWNAELVQATSSRPSGGSRGAGQRLRRAA